MATPTVDFEIEGLKELAKNVDKLRKSFDHVPRSGRL